MKKTFKDVKLFISIGKIVAIMFFLQQAVYAQNKNEEKVFTQIDTEAFADNTHHWYDIADKDNIINARPNQQRYKATELAHIADNILLYQKDNGGWPKNYDMMAVLTNDQKDSVLKAKHLHNTTFDNGTTYTQVEALSNVYSVLHKEEYKKAALKGLQFILTAQYKNGGWPQYYPLEENYSRHITYNDGAFTGIMQLLKNMIENKPAYSFIDNKLRQTVKQSYEKGLDCIIKTQIKDNGKLTAWCQQHDEVTLAPAWARAFEPPSICNGESSDVVLFLMTISNPSKAVINAIDNAVEWFSASRIYNTRVKIIPATVMATKYRVSKTDRIVVNDSAAPPIWTRYYELKTHLPLFCNRDSKVVYSLAEVDRERRDGYGWYTYSPQKVLNSYQAWQKKWKSAKKALSKR